MIIIIYPAITKLMENMDSRYTLVMAAAKRARALGEPDVIPMVDLENGRMVSTAVTELEKGLLTILPAADEEQPSNIEYSVNIHNFDTDGE